MSERVLSFLSRGDVLTAGSALAAFLVLSWILRGAAPGRSLAGEPEGDAPLASRRDRMVFGVALGLVLILIGAGVAATQGVPWALPIFGMGFLMVVSLTRMNRRYRHESPTLRRTIDVSDAFLDISLLAGVLIVLNVLAFRYGGTPLDLTREGTYSLTPESVARVRALDRPVTFTILSGASPIAEQHKSRVIQLLDAYKSINPEKIRIASLNPYEDLTRIEDLARRVPELGLLRGGGVLIEYGEDKETAPIIVRTQEMFDEPSRRQRRVADYFESNFKGEDAITSALDRLRRGKGVKVAFTVGHGEPKPDDMSGNGLGTWRTRLARVGYEVSEIRLDQPAVAGEEEPAVVIVAGPRDPFRPEEVARLRERVDRGKPVLLLLGNEHPSGLDPLLKAYNVEIGPGIVIDPRSNYGGIVENVLVPSQSGPGHPISSAMSPDRSVLVPHSAPIRILGPTGAPGRPPEPIDRTLVPTPILQAGRNAWAESDLKNPRPTYDPDADGARGPVLGVAIAKRPEPEPRPGSPIEEEPRLVLFSCPYMALDSLQDRFPANLDLLMNAASWLRGGKGDTLGLSPRTHVALTLMIDPQLRSRLILVPTLTAAMLIIAVGLIVYTSRRE